MPIEMQVDQPTMGGQPANWKMWFHRLWESVRGINDGAAFLAEDNTFTGDNTFDGETAFNDPVGAGIAPIAGVPVAVGFVPASGEATQSGIAVAGPVSSTATAVNGMTVTPTLTDDVTNFNGYGSILDMDGHDASVLTHFRAFDAVNPGTVTNQAGFFCGELTAGGNNYPAFFEPGSDPAVLGSGAQFKVAGAGSTPLDHNEDGVFTPGLVLSDTSNNSVPFALGTPTAVGEFARFGNTVFYSIYLGWVTTNYSTTTHAGTLRVTGLPYAAGSAIGNPATIRLNGVGWPANTAYVVAETNNGQTYLTIQGVVNNATSAINTFGKANATVSDSVGALVIMGSYKV